MGLWLFLCGGVAFLASSIALCPGELIKQRSEPPTPKRLTSPTGVCEADWKTHRS